MNQSRDWSGRPLSRTLPARVPRNLSPIRGASGHLNNNRLANGGGSNLMPGWHHAKRSEFTQRLDGRFYRDHGMASASRRAKKSKQRLASITIHHEEEEMTMGTLSSNRHATSLPSLVPPSPPSVTKYQSMTPPGSALSSQSSSRQGLQPMSISRSSQRSGNQGLSPQELKRRKMERIVKRQAARIAYLEGRLDNVRDRKASEIKEMEQVVQEDKNRAAAIIQRASQRKLTWVEGKRRELAANLIQKAERGRQGRVAAKQRQVEVTHMNHNAAVIQSLYRGHQTRLKHWKKKILEEEEIRSATIIQAYYRGHVQRLYYRKLIASLALMQAVVRGRVTRKRVLKIRRELRNMAQGAENIHGLAAGVMDSKNKRMLHNDIDNLQNSADYFKKMEGEFMVEDGESVGYLDTNAVLKIKSKVQQEVKNMEKATKHVKQYASGKAARKLVHEMMAEMSAMHESVGTIDQVAEMSGANELEQTEMLRPKTRDMDDSSQEMIMRAVRRMLTGLKPLHELQPDEICKVLEAKKFGSWVICFSRNKVDGAMLADPDLSEQDLAELGVEIRVDRSRMLRIFKAYREKGVPIHDFRTEKEVLDMLRADPMFEFDDIDSSKGSCLETTRSNWSMKSTARRKLGTARQKQNAKPQTPQSRKLKRTLSKEDKDELKDFLASEIFAKDLKMLEGETAVVRPTDKQKVSMMDKDVADAGKVLEAAIEAVNLLGPITGETVKEVQNLANGYLQADISSQIQEELVINTKKKTKKKSRVSYQSVMEHRGVSLEVVDAFISEVMLQAIEGRALWSNQKESRPKPRRRSSLVLMKLDKSNSINSIDNDEKPIAISLNTDLAMVNPNNSQFDKTNSGRRDHGDGIKMIEREVNNSYLAKVVEPNMEENRFPDDRTEYETDEEEDKERAAFDESIFLDANCEDIKLDPPATPDEGSFSMEMTLRSPDKVHGLNLDEADTELDYLDLEILASEHRSLEDLEMLGDNCYRRLSKISETSCEQDTPHVSDQPESFEKEEEKGFTPTSVPDTKETQPSQEQDNPKDESGLINRKDKEDSERCRDSPKHVDDIDDCSHIPQVEDKQQQSVPHEEAQLLNDEPPTKDGCCPSDMHQKISSFSTNDVAEVAQENMVDLAESVEGKTSGEGGNSNQISMPLTSVNGFETGAENVPGESNGNHFEMNFEESFDDTDDVDDLNVLA